MSNRIEELSFKYKKYCLKKYFKIALACVVLSASVLLPYQYFYVYKTVDSVYVHVKVMDEVTKVRSHNPPLYTPEVDLKKLSSVSLEKSKKVYTKAKKVRPNQTYYSKQTVKSRVPKVSFFTSIKDDKSLEIWIDKYNKNKSYSSAIHISKEYYGRKEYKQAGIWAKRANQINREKEEAWLYYAKSVYSLGDLPKAKRILSIFLQYEKSIKAELLLSEWGA